VSILLTGSIGLWHREANPSGEGHHLRYVQLATSRATWPYFERAVLTKRDASVVRLIDRPRSKARRDAHLLAPRRTRRAPTLFSHFPSSLFSPHELAALTQRPTLYRAVPFRIAHASTYPYLRQPSSSSRHRPTHPCPGSASSPLQARFRRAGRGRLARSGSVRRSRRKTSRCASGVVWAQVRVVGTSCLSI